MLERAPPPSSPTAKPPRARGSPRHAASTTSSSSFSSSSLTMEPAGRRGSAPDALAEPRSRQELQDTAAARPTTVCRSRIRRRYTRAVLHRCWREHMTPRSPPAMSPRLLRAAARHFQHAIQHFSLAMEYGQGHN